MTFGTIKTTIEVIKKGSFGGAYFREIYSCLLVNGTESHVKNLVT